MSRKIWCVVPREHVMMRSGTQAVLAWRVASTQVSSYGQVDGRFHTLAVGGSQR